MKKSKQTFFLILLACLTLGLAPFFPEPHIWGKIKWIAGGAKGMDTKDWLDVVLHGSPWVVLIFYSIKKFLKLS